MIRVQVGLPPSPATLNVPAVVGLVQSAAGQMSKIHPDVEFWEVTAARGKSRYDIRDGFGHRASYVLAVGDGANRIPVGSIVQVLFDGRDRSRMKILAVVGSADWAPFVPTPLLLTLGPWDEAWGSCLRNPVGGANADPANWPGDICYDYNTRHGDQVGIYGTPHGLVFFEGDQAEVILVHRMGSEETGDVVGLRVHRLEPTADYWQQLHLVDIPLEGTIETALDKYSPDTDVLLYGDSGQGNQKLVLFPRQLSGSGAYRVFTLDPWNNNEFEASTITVGSFDSRTMSCPSFALDRLAKLNMIEDTIFGYALNGLTWTDLWSKVWRTELTTLLGGGTWTLNGGGAVLTNGGSTNYGFPARVDAGGLKWLVPVTCNKQASLSTDSQSGDSNNLYQGSIRELAIDANTGDINHETVIWEKENFVRSEIPVLMSVLTPFAAHVVDAFEGYQPSLSTSEQFWSCPGTPGGPFPYTRTHERKWHGVMLEDYMLTVNSFGNVTFDLYFPGVGNGVPGLLGTRREGVKAAPAPLPARRPNYQAGDSQHWDGRRITNSIVDGDSTNLAQPNTRHVATPSGYRYCAVLIPVPFLALSTTTGSVADSGSTVWQDRTEFGDGCWFVTYELRQAGIVPIVQFAYELQFVRISSDNTVTRYTPLPRRTGCRYASSGFAQTYEATEEVPVPENCYGIVVFEDHDLVCWLHDNRSAPTHQPYPMITVTNLALTEVLYQIPGSHLADLDTFTEDQVNGETTWAREGDYKYWLHNTNHAGPVAKGYVRPEGGDRPVLIVGTEWFSKSPADVPTAGETIGQTAFFKLLEDGYEVAHKAQASATWTSPSIASVSNREGPEAVRSLAIGGDVLIRVDLSDGNALRQIKP